MKKIEICVIAILSVSVISLLVYIFMLMCSDLECSRKHLYDDLRLWGTHDAVPDEETAIKIAKVVLNAQSMELEPNINYEVEVTFYEEENLWRVYFGATDIIADTINRVVYIRKDSGIIFAMARC